MANLDVVDLSNNRQVALALAVEASKTYTGQYANLSSSYQIIGLADEFLKWLDKQV